MTEESTDSSPGRDTADRPPLPPRSARAVLALGILLGLGAVAYRLHAEPELLGVDFAIYVGAAEALLAGQPIYGVAHGPAGWAQYLYPPGTLPAFVPFLVLPETLRFPAFLALTIAAGVWAGGTLTRAIDHWGGSVDSIDRGLVTGFVVLSSLAAPTFLTGNVNGLLAVAAIAGVVWVARDRPLGAGAALGIAACVKLFPAPVVAPWLLARREWRAIAAATATGVGVLAVGLLAVGVDGHTSYVTEAVLGRPARVSYTDGMPATHAVVSLRRPLSVLFPTAPRWAIAVGAFLPALPVAAFLARSVETRIDSLVTLLGSGLAVLVALPAFGHYLAYLAVGFVPLLYLLPRGTVRRLFVPGTVLLLLPIQVDEVHTVVELVVSSAAAETAVALTRPVLSLATPPLMGVVLVVAACVVHRHGRRAS